MRLALFDDRVPNDVRNKMAAHLRRFIPTYVKPKKRFGKGFWRPAMPNVNFRTCLSELVGPSSPIFFKSFNVDVSFLMKSAAEWHNDPSYLKGNEKLKQLHVVNDLAERGCKLAAEYLSSAKSDNRFQNVLLANCRVKSQELF